MKQWLYTLWRRWARLRMEIGDYFFDRRLKCSGRVYTDEQRLSLKEIFRWFNVYDPEISIKKLTLLNAYHDLCYWLWLDVKKTILFKSVDSYLNNTLTKVEDYEYMQELVNATNVRKVLYERMCATGDVTLATKVYMPRSRYIAFMEWLESGTHPLLQRTTGG